MTDIKARLPATDHHLRIVTRRLRSGESMMFERLKKWNEQNRERTRCASLSESDLKDIGLSRDGLQAVIPIGAQVRDRQLAMAQRHGVQERDMRAHPQDLYSALQACAACEETRDCAKFLASDAPASDAARFCPNHTLLGQLSQD